MATVTLTNLPVAGAKAVASSVTNALNALAAAINGGLDDTNVAAAAGIAATKLAAVPACRVTNSGDQSIPNATQTAVTFDTEAFDTDGIHSTSVNTDRLTCATAGVYLVTAYLPFVANPTGYRLASLQWNGATTVAAQATLPNSNGNQHPVTVSTVYKLAVGDYMRVLAYQTSGGALSVSGQSFSMIRLSA